MERVVAGTKKVEEDLIGEHSEGEMSCKVASRCCG